MCSDGGFLPRVLMVVESCGGGTGRHVGDLCKGLVARGCDVHLLFSFGRVDHLFLDRMVGLDGVRCKQLPMRRGIHPSDFRSAKAARRYMRENGPFDVVHGHSSKGGAIARLAALGTGVPAFYTLHGFGANDPTIPRAKRLLYQVIELALARVTERVIAVSPEERRGAVRLGLGESRVLHIPNGVRRSEAAPRDEARAALGVADDAVVIGFVGRFVAQKAPEVLVRAMRRVAAEVPAAVLALVGGGELEATVRRAAAESGLDGRVLWLGERDARALVGGFDVFAIPSRTEGLPYVVLEAMAAGLPVVATDRAGAESLVEPGVNGLMVPVDDPAALGEALLTLARDGSMRRRFGEASLRRVADFSVDAMVERTLAAYAEAMRRRNRPAGAPAGGHAGEAAVGDYEVATS
jgi:glycosyltransferase involved in cell wall biosynthesis